MKKTNFLVSAALLMVIGLTFVGCGSNIETGLRKHELWKLQYDYNKTTAKNKLNEAVNFIYNKVREDSKATISADQINKKVDALNKELRAEAESEVLVKIKPAKIVYKGGDVTSGKYYDDKNKILENAESEIRDLFKLELSK